MDWLRSSLDRLRSLWDSLRSRLDWLRSNWDWLSSSWDRLRSWLDSLRSWLDSLGSLRDLLRLSLDDPLRDLSGLRLGGGGNSLGLLDGEGVVVDRSLDWLGERPGAGLAEWLEHKEGVGRRRPGRSGGSRGRSGSCSHWSRSGSRSWSWGGRSGRSGSGRSGSRSGRGGRSGRS